MLEGPPWCTPDLVFWALSQQPPAQRPSPRGLATSWVWGRTEAGPWGLCPHLLQGPVKLMGSSVRGPQCPPCKLPLILPAQALLSPLQGPRYSGWQLSFAWSWLPGQSASWTWLPTTCRNRVGSAGDPAVQDLAQCRVSVLGTRVSGWPLGGRHPATCCLPAPQLQVAPLCLVDAWPTLALWAKGAAWRGSRKRRPRRTQGSMRGEGVLHHWGMRGTLRYRWGAWVQTEAALMAKGSGHRGQRVGRGPQLPWGDRRRRG